MVDIYAMTENGISGVTSLIEESPLAAAAGAAGIGAAVGLGVGAVIGQTLGGKSKGNKTRSSRKGNSRIKHTSRGWKQDRKRRSKQKWEVAYQKRKRKKGRKSKGRRGKIYYAKKTGQPYILKANGQAKFIKGRRKK